jgi:hypothetical protein
MNMPSQNNGEIEKQATYFTLTGLFSAIFVAFAAQYKRRHRKKLELRPLDLGLLGMATYRLGHLAANDKVLEFVRKPFTQTVPDESGAGLTVQPKGKGFRHALGELISCPVCAGTWIAAGLVYGLHLIPGPTRVFMTIMGAVGASELLNAVTKALNWSGQAARQEVGELKKLESEFSASPAPELHNADERLDRARRDPQPKKINKSASRRGGTETRRLRKENLNSKLDKKTNE